MIRIIARFQCDAGQATDVEAVLRGMIASTRAEPGCVQYDLHRLEGGFLLDEAYTDDAAVQAHRASSHYLTYREAISSLLSAPIEVLKPEPIDVA